MRAIQFIDESNDEATAEQAFTWLQTQVGYLGGRILSPSASKPKWRVQAFFEDEPAAEWLPDGCLRVLILDRQRRMLGVRAL
jgi:hypothetical protein